MNKVILPICLILLSHLSFSQVNVGSLGFSYSALVRDSIGRVQPLKPVKLRFTLLLGQTGTATNSPWIETQSVTTDAYGFVNVIIGNGTRTGGTAAAFAAVDFSTTNYWLLIEVYNINTSNYDVLNKQALQAVPYAKVAGSIGGSGAVPAGTIVAFGGDTTRIPAGWLWCNGVELNNTDPRYQALFNAIQYNWGTSNHTTLFRIPNTKGIFMRGAGNGSGSDPDAASRTASFTGGNVGDNVGTYQADMVIRHNHTVQSAGTRTGKNPADPSGNFFASSGDCCDYGVKYMTTVTNTSLGLETRPKNIYVNYIIKL